MSISGRDPYPRRDFEHEKYVSCPMCGAWFVRFELSYDAGSVAPTIGETITGAGGCTGVVTAYSLDSGTWAGGDAAGVIELSGVTGSADFLAYVDNEALTGSSTFAGTADGQAIQKNYGHRIPYSQAVQRDGKYWCISHHNFRFNKKDRDEAKIRVEEID